MKVELEIEYQGKTIHTIGHSHGGTNCPVCQAFQNWKHENDAKGARLIRGS